MDDLRRRLHGPPQGQQAREGPGELRDHDGLLLTPGDPVGHRPRVGPAVEEGGAGQLAEGGVEGAAGGDDPGPPPAGAGAAVGELGGRPALDHGVPSGRPQRPRHTETGTPGQPLEDGRGPLRLALGSLRGFQDGPADPHAAPLTAGQRLGDAAHTEGVEDGPRGKDGTRLLGHARHPAGRPGRAHAHSLSARSPLPAMPRGRANTPQPYARSEARPPRAAGGICQKQQRIECGRIPYGPPQPVRQSRAAAP